MNICKPFILNLLNKTAVLNIFTVTEQKQFAPINTQTKQLTTVSAAGEGSV